MLEIVKPIYIDENATEVNKNVEKVIDELELESEVIGEHIMDISLDDTERREKTFSELMENPDELHKMVALISEREKLDRTAEKLRNAIYKGYDNIPVSTEVHVKPATKRLNQGECLMWLSTQVKPLILGGETRQNEISKKLSSHANTISQRVKRAYDVSWEEYVEFVQQGIF